MDELEKLLGPELFTRLKQKLGDVKLLIDDGKLIPKHRFDCINLSLKDHKEQVKELREKNAALENELKSQKELQEKVKDLEKQILIYSVISKSKARNIQTILPLLHVDDLFGMELVESLEKQIRSLRRSDSYLFTDGSELYRIVPYSKKEKTEI